MFIWLCSPRKAHYNIVNIAFQNWFLMSLTMEDEDFYDRYLYQRSIDLDPALIFPR